MCVCLVSVHLKKYYFGFLDFSFEKYAIRRLTCASCLCVLLHVLNTLVVEKDRKKGLFLAFLGRSHFEMFYSHAYLCTRD